MSESYYKPCRELDICNELIQKYFITKQYKECFSGHLVLAEQGYPLAECQIGYFYYDGLGVEKNQEKAVYWTRRAAEHGDRDGQYNLAWFHEEAIGVERDMEQAIFWYRKAALQEHDLAEQKCRELGVSLDISATDREPIRKDLKCRIYPLGYLESYKYTVICTFYRGSWILSKHRNRSTWETQGGHIEAGETPLACARRELFEESGIQDADLYPVCDYWGFNFQRCSNGVVFLAVVHSLGELPESEMQEIKLFKTLPADLTYPLTTPKLYEEAEKLLKDMRCRMVISGVSEAVEKELIAVAEKNNIKKLVVFGSRARGDHRRTSDIDLAVSGGNISAFSVDIEELVPTLLEFDVVNLDGAVQEELRESIRKEGKTVYEKV